MRFPNATVRAFTTTYAVTRTDPCCATTVETGELKGVYNGSTWTSVNSMNTARRLLGGAGIQTAALAFGGTPPVTGATEEWLGAGSPTTVTITAS